MHFHNVLNVLYFHALILYLKVENVIFQKRFRKRGRVPKQTCSQSAVRGVSTHDVEERAFSEQPSRATER